MLEAFGKPGKKHNRCTLLWTSDISREEISQFIQEALGMERTEYGERSLVGAPCLVLSAPVPRDMNWSLLMKDLKRRAEALAYFGSFCNILADVQIQKTMMGMQLVPEEW